MNIRAETPQDYAAIAQVHIRAFEGATVQAWGAGMGLSLLPGIFDEFCVQLKSGARLPGSPIWPTAFDLD